MKKQSLGALLLATSLLATGFVSSCKDNDSDLFTELDRELSDQATLSQALQAQIDELESKISDLESKKECTCQMTEEWKQLLSTGSFDQAFSDTWYAYYSKLYATSESVAAAADAAQEALDYAKNLESQVNKNSADIITLSGKIADLNALITAAQTTANEAKSLANDALSKATAAQTTADSALSLAQTNQTTLGDLSKSLNTLTNTVNLLSESLKAVNDTAMAAYSKAVILEGEYNSLRFSVDSLGNITTALGDTLKAQGVRVDSLSTLLSNLDGKVDGLNTTVGNLNTTVGSLNTTVGEYTHRIDSLGRVIDGFATMDTVEYYVDSLGQVTTALDAKIALSIDSVRNEAQANLQLAYNYAAEVAQQLVDSLGDTLRNYTDYKIAELRNDLSESIEDNKAKIDSFRTVILDNQSRISALETSVGELSDDVSELKTTVNKLKEDFTNLVTGLIIQGTDDPVFGYMALPFGIQTNILAAYYGSISQNVTFPKKVFTEAEIAKGADGLVELNSDTYKGGSVLISDADGNAGKIYLTINPTSVDFSGRTLNIILENSKGEQSSVVLKNIQKSDALLTFGVTRANNGFYEADAYLSPDAAASVAPSINLNDFKTVAKDLLNNHTFDIATAVSAVYNAVNCKLPRYAAKTYWINSEGKEVAVYSNYAIAATSLKPLSFNFLKDYNVSTTKISHIDPSTITSAIDQMTDSIKIELNIDTLDLDLALDFDFNFTMPNLNLAIKWDSLSFGDEGKTMTLPFTYEMPQYEPEIEYSYTYYEDPETGKRDSTQTGIVSVTLVEKGKEIVETKVTVTGMDSIYTNIANQVNARMDSVVQTITNFSDSINAFTSKLDTAFNKLKELQAFTTKLSGLQTQVNTILSSINGTLDTQVSKLVGTIKSQLTGTINNYVGTINNYIDKVNTVISRVTAVINNLNSKLQPALMYKTTSGSLAVVSTAKALPTQVTVSGGNAMELIPTTYTAEVLAPAYKKYLVVTNVFKGDKSAQGGDATCKAAMEAANNTDCFFNTVIDGNQRVVVFTSGSEYKGCIYEVTYNALDYTGVEASKRFYIQIR